MTHLGIRLQAVVDMVDTGSVAADIDATMRWSASR